MKFAPGRLSLVCSPLLSLCLLGCGAGSKDVESPAPAPTDEGPPQGSESAASAPEEETEAEASGPAAIPNTCHNGDSPCTASPKWVKRLCSDVYPAVALYLNQPDSPFTRGYLSRKTKAINASGGVTSGDEWLEFDEQVVLLFHRSAGPGGMQVSGAEGGFDAIRWDGSCVTLDGSEVRLQKPPSPKTANIDWRYLGEDVQDALKAVPEVREAYIDRKNECKGAYSGGVSKKCVQKDEVLKKAIILAVQSGAAKLPQPELRP